MVIDFAGAELAVHEPTVPATGVVAGVRVGRPNDTLARVTLDLVAAAELAGVALLAAAGDDPCRLVVDLAATEFAGVARAAAAPAATAFAGQPVQVAEAADAAAEAPEATMAVLPLPPRKPPVPSGVAGDRELPLIVIDAGHGGVDPGAIGPSGLEEKEVTLAIAKALRQQLLADGRYRVQLTRQDDRFIALRERFGLAQQAGASLFVSLHADAHRNPLLRGASVYTLSEKASDAETEALAAKENKSDLLGGVQYPEDNELVGTILLDMTRYETLNYSREFAKELVSELKRDTLLLRNTERYAGFAVLKAPDIPSVLVELGYLSNTEDEALLQSAKHQRKLAGAIARAIELYFEAHPQQARLN
jgi:N-acetylmuramoyl-L-alanine amidase